MRNCLARGVLVMLIATVSIPALLWAEEQVETIRVGPEDSYYGEVEYMHRVTENGSLTRMEVYFTDSHSEETGLLHQFEYIKADGRLYRFTYRFADWYRDYWGIDSFGKYVDADNNTTRCSYGFYDGTEVEFDGDRMQTIFSFIPKKATSHFEDYFFVDGRRTGETVIQTDKDASSLVRIESRPNPMNREEQSFLEEWLQTPEGSEYRLADFAGTVRTDEDGESVTFIVHSDVADTIQVNRKYLVGYYYAGGVYPQPYCIAVVALVP